MTEKTGTFVATHVDEGSAVLKDVETAQVHTIDESPSFDAGTVLEATIAPQPPTEVVWELRSIDERWTVDLIDSDLSPTNQAESMVADEPPGTVVRTDRAGTGEIHVLAVPAGEEAATAADVLADEETIARAARLGAVRVEVRTGDGLVSVRYLPE